MDIHALLGPDLGGAATAFLQVVLIDVALAGDNAVVVGMAVAGLPEVQQRRAIMGGIAAAAVIRIVLALVTVRLLAIPGIALLGGLMLLYVCWSMFRELRSKHAHTAAAKGKTLRQAIMQIIVADVSMSLDNVLAVAGAAREYAGVLVIGLILSVVLMGVAANFIARLLERFPAIAWAGLAIVFYVAARMVKDGAEEVIAICA